MKLAVKLIIPIYANIGEFLITFYSKRKNGEYFDSESTSSVDDFPGSKMRIKNLHLIGIKNLNSGFPEKIKEENEEATTKTKISGKMNNFTSLHK